MNNLLIGSIFTSGRGDILHYSLNPSAHDMQAAFAEGFELLF